MTKQPSPEFKAILNTAILKNARIEFLFMGLSLQSISDIFEYYRIKGYSINLPKGAI